TDDEIRTDIEFLGKTWNEIKERSEQRKAPALLHHDLNLVERILRDYVSDDFTAIWIDSEEEYGKVAEFVSRFQPKLASRVKLYTKEQPIFEEFGIQHELDKALRAKVWLKSGGYIVINHTEALVAFESALLQRVRPRLHHAQAHQAGARTRPLPALPLVQRLRYGQVHPHALLRNPVRSAQDGRRRRRGQSQSDPARPPGNRQSAQD